MQLTFGRTAACLALVLAAPMAQAGLGEGVATVARDHAALNGRALTTTPMQAYDRHDLTTSSGTRIRQYVSRAGTVFAVSFEGPVVPDLKVLLGTRYGDYVVATASRRINHKVLTIDSPNLAMQVVKLPRGFSARAFAPDLVPAGVARRDLL
jgi:hypothetical protein